MSVFVYSIQFNSKTLKDEENFVKSFPPKDFLFFFSRNFSRKEWDPTNISDEFAKKFDKAGHFGNPLVFQYEKLFHSLLTTKQNKIKYR